MAKLIRDPQLEALVRELNDGGVPPGELDADSAFESGDEGQEGAPRPPQAPPLHLPEGNPLEALLIEAAQRGASDLLIVAGVPPVFRVGGRLVRAGETALSSEDIQSLFAAVLTGRVREKLEADGSADFSLRLGRASSDEDRRAWRFRV